MMTEQSKAYPPTHFAYYLQPQVGSYEFDHFKVGEAWEYDDKNFLRLTLINLGQEITLLLIRNEPEAK